MNASMWKRELIAIIKKDLSDIKRKNPRYSLRAYSKRIGVGFGSLSDLLNLKRDLSPQLAKRILHTVSLDKEQMQRFAGLIERDLNKKVTMLPQEAQVMVENWYYFAVLNLLELDFSPKTSFQISMRLGLPEATVRKSLVFLLKGGFLKKVNDGFVVITNSWKTSDGISSESGRKAHLEGLLLAQRALVKLPLETRDITSFVFNGNSKQIEKVRLETRKFLNRINKIMSIGELDSVYRFNTQLFPLDKWGEFDSPKKKKLPP